MTTDEEDAVAEVLATVILAERRAMHTRLDALEARLTAVEDKPSLEYLGTWATDKTYRRGNAVTRAGSVWILNKAATTTTAPGTPEGASAWTLACKRGSDGRDAP